MIFPGGDALERRAAELVFDQFEALEAVATPGYRPRVFARLTEADQNFWIGTMRPVIEVVTLALLSDMAEAVSSYDGCQGAAYQRTVHRYALHELDLPLHQPPE